MERQRKPDRKINSELKSFKNQFGELIFVYINPFQEEEYSIYDSGRVFSISLVNVKEVSKKWFLEYLYNEKKEIMLASITFVNNYHKMRISHDLYLVSHEETMEILKLGQLLDEKSDYIEEILEFYDDLLS